MTVLWIELLAKWAVKHPVEGSYRRANGDKQLKQQQQQKQKNPRNLSICYIILKPFVQERDQDSALLSLHFEKKNWFLQTAKCRFDLFHITTGNVAIARTNKSSQSTIQAKTKLGGRPAAKATRQPSAAARRIELNSCSWTLEQPLLSGEETFIFHRFRPHMGPNDG